MATGDVLTEGSDGLADLVSPSTSGKVLTSNGTGVQPTFQTTAVGTVTNTGTLTSGKLIQGNGGVDVTANATTATVVKLTAGTPSAASAGTDYTDAAFKTIVVAGQSNIVADSAADTLTLVAGANITLTTNASTDTLTIAASAGAGVDYVVLSNGVQPPTAVDDGAGQFIYVGYTP